MNLATKSSAQRRRKKNEHGNKSLDGKIMNATKSYLATKASAQPDNKSIRFWMEKA